MSDDEFVPRCEAIWGRLSNFCRWIPCNVPPIRCGISSWISTAAAGRDAIKRRAAIGWYAIRVLCERSSWESMLCVFPLSRFVSLSSNKGIATWLLDWKKEASIARRWIISYRPLMVRLWCHSYLSCVSYEISELVSFLISAMRMALTTWYGLWYISPSAMLFCARKCFGSLHSDVIKRRL